MDETRNELPVEEQYEPDVQCTQEDDALQTLTKERDRFLDMAQRAQAEFDNYRRRNQTAVSEAYQNGGRDVLAAVLLVADNLERALATAKESEAEGIEGHITGLEMIHKQLLDIFDKFDVAAIPTDGMFDPNLHNAVMQGPADETHPQGHILEVFQKGYTCKDKVIRYSMVRVAQ